MSRYIDADAMIANALQDSERLYLESVAKHTPSIDIVRCKECRWVRYCETEDLDMYLDCDKPDGGGIPRNDEWFCADGEREGE